MPAPLDYATPSRRRRRLPSLNAARQISLVIVAYALLTNLAFYSTYFVSRWRGAEPSGTLALINALPIPIYTLSAVFCGVAAACKNSSFFGGLALANILMIGICFLSLPLTIE